MLNPPKTGILAKALYPLLYKGFRHVPILGAAWIVFCYALFFLVAPIHDMNPDYFDYYSLTDRWLKGDWRNYDGVLIDLPLGFPFFLLLQKMLGISSLSLIFIFCLGLLATYWFLAAQLVKYRGWAGGFSALFLALYLTDGESMRQFTALMPDAPYLLVLLWTLTFFFGMLLGSYPKRDTILFAFVALLLPVFRSNGIAVFPVLAGLILVLWFQRRAQAYLLLKSSAGFFILFVGLSYLAVGYLNYGNPYRILKILGGNNTKPITVSASYQKPKAIANRFKTYYLYSFSIDRPQFFKNQIPTRIKKHLLFKKTINEANYGMYDGASPVPNEWKQMVQKEYEAISPKFNLEVSEPLKTPEGHFKTGLIGHSALALLHVAYGFYSLILNSKVVLALFYLSTLFFLFHSLRSRLFLSFEIMVLALFFSMVGLLVVGSGLSLPRYAFPTDTLPILVLPLLLNATLPTLKRKTGPAPNP
jgi:hypothetical protein